MILPATTADIPELVQLVNAAYRGNGWTTEAHLIKGPRIDAAALQEQMNTPQSVILKYLDDSNKMLGCVYLEKQEQKMFLGLLTVSPDVQGGGIGKQLLQAGVSYAKEQQCNVITITVVDAREDLIAWYERHGYRKTGETKPLPPVEKIGEPMQPLSFLVLERVV